MSFLEAQQCHTTAVHKCIKNSGNVSFVDDKKNKYKILTDNGCISKLYQSLSNACQEENISLKALKTDKKKGHQS